MDTPIRVGLVGAGHWAEVMHGPTLAAGPETTLTGVWARRPDAARRLAAQLGTTAADDFDALLDRCAAVAFAVPPDVQADLAVRAAEAGRHVLLEKPVALTVADAERVAKAVRDNGVVSQLVLTKRYHPATRAFLAAAAEFETIGARARYLHGGFLDGPFATGWRLDHGALVDLGPHLLDLVEAAVGRIETVTGHGASTGWLELTCAHRGGAVSQLSLSGSVRLPRSRAGVELYGRSGVLEIDFATIDHAECWPVLRSEFAHAVRTGTPHPLDADHGLRLQHLLVVDQPGQQVDRPGDDRDAEDVREQRVAQGRPADR
ncbi:Gfo/Idh/MocA family oxidoreductase [Asanoa sp. WMMD1127]|uniref:Gfo/Idh/MocA family protein n=1 Tax=Asanoa sp. WMMD1127 TaxID=3016107 RepID=UPI002415F98E|nr:Gfo/Idh/MocA family oxidoreductase [Asanoa sp. WMMD1127]MDG4826593.1 Gfo/Idh/MocA family oxidoreductase [Asanoa sp. WMMD1127]